MGKMLLAISFVFSAMVLFADSSLKLQLPEKIYAVPGIEANIYFDNIVLTPNSDIYVFDVTCKKGRNDQKRWRFVPTDKDVGEYDWSVKVIDASGTLAEGKTKLIVSPADAGKGKSISILLVGDSLTSANVYPIRLFELANVYTPRQQPLTELPEERLHLGMVAFGEGEDFFTLKGAVEALGAAFGITFDYRRAQGTPWLHPGISADILCGGEKVGVFGKLANDVTAELKLPKDSRDNQKIFLAEIDWASLMAHRRPALRYEPVPEFETVARDLALVANEDTACGDIMAEMRRACPNLGEVELFDIYRSAAIGEGKKSMAFTLHFVPAGKPLAAEDVDRFVKKILGNLKYRLNIDIR